MPLSSVDATPPSEQIGRQANTSHDEGSELNVAEPVGAAESQEEAAVIGPSPDGAAPSSQISEGPPVRARPQVIGGEEVWPERWGMTRQQIADLLVRLKHEEGWDSDYNVYAMVTNYIIPWTRGTGVGYALSVNAAEPKEVTLMVSHAWGENAEAFLEALLRSSSQDDVLFVCSLSIYQPEDGVGPTIMEQIGSDPMESPFRRVLEHIKARGVAAGCRWRPGGMKWLPQAFLLVAVVSFYVPTLAWSCVPSFHECAEQTRHSDNGWDSLMKELHGTSKWHWVPLPYNVKVYVPISLVMFAAVAFSSIYLHFRRHSCFYRGRMVAVPNAETDIYSRLWCVYEIFVALNLGVPVEMARSLAFAGRVSSRQATCSSEHDAARIRREIETGSHSYDYIDKAVFLVTRRARWECAQALLTTGLKIAVTNVAYFCMSSGRTRVWEHVLCMLLGFTVAINCIYGVFQSAQGKPKFCTVFLCGALLSVTGGILLFCHVADGIRELQSAFWALVTSGVYVMVFLIVGVCCCSQRLKERGKVAILVAVSVAIFVGCTLTNGFADGFDGTYPDAVQNASFVAGYFWAPAVVWWSAALHWGVKIKWHKGWTVVSCVGAARVAWRDRSKGSKPDAPVDPEHAA